MADPADIPQENETDIHKRMKAMIEDQKRSQEAQYYPLPAPTIEDEPAAEEKPAKTTTRKAPAKKK